MRTTAFVIVAPVPPLVFPLPITTVPLKGEVPSTNADSFEVRTQAPVIVALVSFVYPTPILTVPVHVEAFLIATVPVKVEAPSTVVATYTLRTPASVMMAIDPLAV